MKTSFRVITMSLILLTAIQLICQSQSGPPWVKYNVGYNYILRGIDFPSNQDNIGFIAGESLTYSGDGIVLKTTNGGETWNSVWTGIDQGLEGSCFVDVNTGFVAGWPNTGAGWSGFGKTTNGGTTWTSYQVATDIYFFTDVVFKDANNGIIIGRTNTSAGVWYTSNGGQTWSQGTGLGAIPEHACHISGNTYFLVTNGGHIQKSVNNGMTWTTVHSIPGLLLLGIDRFDDNTIMACGDYGALIKSYDGGTTWEEQQIGFDLWHDFGWETQDHLFVCGTPEIVAESTDGGATWQNGFPASTGQAALYECIFTANGSGFICGSQGTLLKRLPSCSAGFTASSTSVCEKNSVTFTDQSYGSNLTYDWWFEGGIPSTSTEQNPIVAYNTPGSFDVKLTVDNGNWTDSLRRVDYIAVNPVPAAPEVTSDGYTLSSSVPDGNQWFLNGNAIPGATAQTYVATQSGWYWDVVTMNACSSDTSNNIYLVMTGIGIPQKPDVKLFPVPNDGRFSVSIAPVENSPVTLSAYTILGVKIFSETITPTNMVVDLPVDLGNSPDGVYLLEILHGPVRIIQKVVVRK